MRNFIENTLGNFIEDHCCTIFLILILAIPASTIIRIALR